MSVYVVAFVFNCAIGVPEYVLSVVNFRSTIYLSSLAALSFHASGIYDTVAFPFNRRFVGAAGVTVLPVCVVAFTILLGPDSLAAESAAFT